MNRNRKLGFVIRLSILWSGCSGPAPTNAVDACCKLHDECYERHGSTKYCDELFQQCLRPHMNARNKMARDAKLFYRIFELRNRFF